MVREGEKSERPPRDRDGDSNKMGNPVYMKWLLEAIHKIKHQKQRPSVERISHAVRQHHKVSAESIEEQLELAVKEGTILKTVNKGGLCSFKDPSRMNPPSNTIVKKVTLKVAKKTDITRTVVQTIHELGEIGGSTLKSIEKYIRKNYNLEIVDGGDLSHQVRMSVKRGINSGQLMQEGRLYRVSRGHNASMGSSNPITNYFAASPLRKSEGEEVDVVSNVSVKSEKEEKVRIALWLTCCNVICGIFFNLIYFTSVFCQ